MCVNLASESFIEPLPPSELRTFNLSDDSNYVYNTDRAAPTSVPRSLPDPSGRLEQSHAPHPIPVPCLVLAAPDVLLFSATCASVDLLMI